MAPLVAIPAALDEPLGIIGCVTNMISIGVLMMVQSAGTRIAPAAQVWRTDGGFSHD